MLAEVELVETFESTNIDAKKLESILHKFFDSARLNIELKDRFNNPVKSRECFFVPLFIIEKVVEKIEPNTLHQFQYDVATASLKVK